MSNRDLVGKVEAHWAQPMVDNLSAASREWVMTLPREERIRVLSTWMSTTGANSEWAATKLAEFGVEAQPRFEAIAKGMHQGGGESPKEIWQRLERFWTDQGSREEAHWCRLRAEGMSAKEAHQIAYAQQDRSSQALDIVDRKPGISLER